MNYLRAVPPAFQFRNTSTRRDRSRVTPLFSNTTSRELLEENCRVELANREMDVWAEHSYSSQILAFLSKRNSSLARANACRSGPSAMIVDSAENLENLGLLLS